MQKPRIRLSTRDLEMVSMRSAGMLQREIAAATGVSVGTVSVVLRRVRSLLDAAKAQPVVVAIGSTCYVGPAVKPHLYERGPFLLHFDGPVTTADHPPALPAIEE